MGSSIHQNYVRHSMGSSIHQNCLRHSMWSNEKVKKQSSRRYFLCPGDAINVSCPAKRWKRSRFVASPTLQEWARISSGYGGVKKRTARIFLEISPIYLQTGAFVLAPTRLQNQSTLGVRWLINCDREKGTSSMHVKNLSSGLTLIGKACYVGG